MSIKRTVLALTAAAAPLVACGSSSTGESPVSASEAIMINPRLQCEAGPQVAQWWWPNEQTLSGSLAWYQTQMTDPTGPSGLTYVAFAGMNPGTATVESVAWVPQSDVGTFQWYNPTCVSGTGSGPSHIEYISQQTGESGGSTPSRCQPISVATTPAPTACVTVGTVDSFAGMNYCPLYVNAGPIHCPVPTP